MLKQKKIFISVIFSLLSFSNSSGTDLLDNIKSKTKLVNDLKDIYRAFNINHKIADQKELINLYLTDGSEKELNDLLNTYIRVCDTLKQTHFFNDALNNYAGKYLTLTIQNYKIARSKGFGSNEFKRDYKKYKKENEQYLDYLSKAYSTSRFVSMTEKTYWQINDKKNYIKSSNYTGYEKLKRTNLKAALALLEKTSSQTINFQEYSIYQIEIADQYVKHPDNLGDNSKEYAIEKYKSILDKKKYSIYLFESWLKWRAVLQENNGLSKSSDIPNNEYNKIREQAALIILNYITGNQNDKMAINEFLLMATHDIVRRFGSYPYGNQNTVEYHEIFDDKK